MTRTFPVCWVQEKNYTRWRQHQLSFPSRLTSAILPKLSEPWFITLAHMQGALKSWVSFPQLFSSHGILIHSNWSPFLTSWFNLGDISLFYSAQFLAVIILFHFPFLHFVVTKTEWTLWVRILSGDNTFVVTPDACWEETADPFHSSKGTFLTSFQSVLQRAGFTSTCTELGDQVTKLDSIRGWGKFWNWQAWVPYCHPHCAFPLPGPGCICPEYKGSWVTH